MRRCKVKVIVSYLLPHSDELDRFLRDSLQKNKTKQQKQQKRQNKSWVRLLILYILGGVFISKRRGGVFNYSIAKIGT